MDIGHNEWKHDEGKKKDNPLFVMSVITLRKYEMCNTALESIKGHLDTALSSLLWGPCFSVSLCFADPVHAKNPRKEVENSPGGSFLAPSSVEFVCISNFLYAL